MKNKLVSVENICYQRELANRVEIPVFEQGDVDSKLLFLKKAYSNASADEQVDALKQQWKALHKAYKSYLKQAKDVTHYGKPFTVEVNLGDVSKLHYPLDANLQTEHAVSIRLKDKDTFKMTMPVNSTITITDVDGKKLELSAPNTVVANLSNGRFSIDEFCNQNLLNWERNKQANQGKVVPFFLDFLTVPISAQNEIKRRVAQTLINKYVGSSSKAEEEKRREEILNAVVDIE